MPEPSTLQTTLSEMLNMAEERLTSGDYVRVANALKAASKDCEVTPLRIDKKPINNYIKFNTSHGDVMTLIIMYEEVIIMPGDIPDVHNVVYSLNGIQHTEKFNAFVQKMVNVMNCVGMTHIQRNYFVDYSYKNMREFKKDIRKVQHQCELHHDDDDEDDCDCDCDPNDSYVIKLFLGLNILL